MAWSKESRQSRGYGATWDKLRLVILARDGGICQHCLRTTGLVHIGTEVDHIVSKAKALRMKWSQEQIDAESNLQCIGKACHAKKTKEEMGFKPKPVIGPDGWPMVDR
jgi:5-methylcytosine-specific restriction protein A